MVLNGDHLYQNRNVVLGNKKMRRGCHCSLFLTTLVLALQGCASFYFHKTAFSPPPPRSLTLSDNPIREHWTGIVFNGSKIGFSHFRLASAAEEENRFDIQSEAYFRIRFLMLEFSLIKCDKVISDPDRIHTLTVHISGLAYSVALPNDEQQVCKRSGERSVVYQRLPNQATRARCRRM